MVVAQSSHNTTTAQQGNGDHLPIHAFDQKVTKHPHDVILGVSARTKSGPGAYYYHSGNIFYRRLLEERIDEFKEAATSAEKDKVVVSIVNAVYECGGSFLVPVFASEQHDTLPPNHESAIHIQGYEAISFRQAVRRTKICMFNRCLKEPGKRKKDNNKIKPSAMDPIRTDGPNTQTVWRQSDISKQKLIPIIPRYESKLKEEAAARNNSLSWAAESAIGEKSPSSREAASIPENPCTCNNHDTPDSDAASKSVGCRDGRKETFPKGVNYPLQPFDVLLVDEQSATKYYSGNGFFPSLLHQNLKMYQLLWRRNREQINICKHIIDEVDRRGGSFVKLVELGSKTNYEKVPFETLLEKIGFILSRMIALDAAVTLHQYEIEKIREVNSSSHPAHRCNSRKEYIVDHHYRSLLDQQHHRSSVDKASSSRSIDYQQRRRVSSSSYPSCNPTNFGFVGKNAASMEDGFAGTIEPVKPVSNFASVHSGTWWIDSRPTEAARKRKATE